DARTAIAQQIDHWSGTVPSQYTVDGAPEKVDLTSLTDADGIAARVTSPMIHSGRLGVRLTFPYGADCHVCPGYDFEKPDRHKTLVLKSTKHETVLERRLDSMRYLVYIGHTGARVEETSLHEFMITPDDDGDAFEFTVRYSQDEAETLLPAFRRSEERRVGKECRSRWAAEHEEKNNE